MKNINTPHAFAQHIASTAARALMYEVSVSPKPGLVDRFNCGAHSDMNFFTFIDSAMALIPHFNDFVLLGIENYNVSPQDAFSAVRPNGIKGEKSMYLATKGVNTHKGAIFSMGLICLSIGYLYGKNARFTIAEIRRICACMAADHDFGSLADNAKTNGERIYFRYGITGARGEAMGGFANLFTLALPAFLKCIDEGCSLNDSGVIALIHGGA